MTIQQRVITPALTARLGWWVMSGSGAVVVLGALSGLQAEGRTHPIIWLAGSVLLWSVVFLRLRRAEPWSLPLGVAVVIGVCQLLVRDSRTFGVAVTVVVAAVIVAFPFSPRGVRTISLVGASASLFAIFPTGGEDLISSFALSFSGAVCMVVGYGLMGGLESAIRSAEDDNRMLLEAVEHAPVVAMVADVTAIMALLAPLSQEERFGVLSDDEWVERVFRLGRVTWMNDTARRAFGHGDPGERTFGPELGPSDPEVQRKFLEALVTRDRYFTVTAAARAGDSTRWFHANWVLPPERLDRCFVVASDVTEVMEAREQLEQIITDKNNFLATISHELRTPLTAVLGFAREAVDMGSDQSAGEFLQLVVDQAEEMSFIIEDLLTSARAEAGTLTVEPEPIDVGKLVATLVAAIPEHVDVTDTSDVWALADPVRVRQILRNLVSNAVRYGGSSRCVNVQRTARGVAIDVSNDGPGVPASMVDAIFEPYVTSHEPTAVTGSIGLGLAVSRQLARMMGGDLVYEREADTTVFRLTLAGAEPAQRLARSASGRPTA